MQNRKSKLNVNEIVKCAVIVFIILLCDMLLDCLWPKIEEVTIRTFGEKSTCTYSAQVISKASVEKGSEWLNAVVIDTNVLEETVIIPESVTVEKGDYIVVNSIVYSIGTSFVAETEYSDTQHYYATTSEGQYFAGTNKGVVLLTDNIDAAVKFTQLQKDREYGLCMWLSMEQIENQVGNLEFVKCKGN